MLLHTCKSNFAFARGFDNVIFKLQKWSNNQAILSKTWHGVLIYQHSVYIIDNLFTQNFFLNF